MKRILTSALAISLSFAAMAHKQTSGNVVTNPTSNTVALPAAKPTTMAQLEQENANLHNQVQQLANQVQEIEGKLNFERTMAHLFANLQNQQQDEKMAEMQAKLDYERTMQRLFNRIK
ncbi:MAG TPA: hypothetical protein PKD90_02200 [Phnomibacter sp.]|nr:hypothetical protein [Phnomibacter sp.]